MKALRWLFLLLVLPALAASNWQTLKDCKYKPDKYDDGDSFHVVADGTEHIFRLYLVDAPEAEASQQDRLQEQAEYFGITVDEALKIGQAAAKVTEQALRQHKFTVTTRWQVALGRSKLGRNYAFVTVEGKDLGEYLVSEGLARIHGVHVDPPGSLDYKAEFARMARLEKEAQAKHRGAWKFSTKIKSTGTSVTPAIKGDAESSSLSASTETGYRISPGGKRHNSGCRYYNGSTNKPCGPQDGEPCKVCGG